jgi:hypothetical protein
MRICVVFLAGAALDSINNKENVAEHARLFALPLR